MPAREGVIRLMDEARAAGLLVGVCSAATKSSAICVLESLLGKDRFNVREALSLPSVSGLAACWQSAQCAVKKAYRYCVVAQTWILLLPSRLPACDLPECSNKGSSNLTA